MSENLKKNSVLIVGRTNVGKSTFFNRLAPNVRSIALEYEGVTRDFLKDQVIWKDVTFDLIDSGGISLKKTQDTLLQAVQNQVVELAKKAAVILFMVDGTSGIVSEDLEISRFLRKLNKPVILVINKIDSKKAKENVYEFNKLGFNEIQTISAEHGTDIHSILDLIVSHFPKQQVAVEVEKPAYKVMLLGKPNVGKSSLMNKLLDYERSIVSNIAGTTRESVSEVLKFYKESIELFDTPGIRRKSSVEGDIEPLMVKSSFAALKNSDIVMLLIDGSECGLVDQELKLAFYAFTEQYKALILIINKHDLMTEDSQKDLEHCFDEYKHLMKKIPVLTISCESGKNIGKVLPLVNKVWQRYILEIPEDELTHVIVKASIDRPLFHLKQKLEVYAAKQVKTAPFTIEMRVNEPDWFGPSQLSYFENVLRSKYDLVGTPIKFFVRKTKIRSK